jgi:hypothetical protein
MNPDGAAARTTHTVQPRRDDIAKGLIRINAARDAHW